MLGFSCLALTRSGAPSPLGASNPMKGDFAPPTLEASESKGLGFRV